MVGHKDVGLVAIEAFPSPDLNLRPAQAKPVARTEERPRVNQIMFTGQPRHGQNWWTKKQQQHGGYKK